MRLAGKLAVITAAASGMGKAGVELFLREGAKVVAIDVNAEALAQLAAEAKARGQSVETLQADLSRQEVMRSSVHEAAARLGGIDVMWAHAGIPGPAGIEDLDLPAYDRAMALNVDSAALAAGEVIKHMRKRGSGSLIFTASVSGLVGSMFSPVYSAAKFAVVGLTKSLAQTFAPDRVRVNVICPGLTDTPMAFNFTSRSGDPAEAAANERKLLAAVPLGRLCRPDEIAHAALWLASDDASFVTGVALPVDGGFTAR
ncbi:2,5-dichloro-2,5-cyclohexadiene-1,4-diol dehydrogenase [Bosea thiooxidans]|uniref:2,5-dichloro-2,5-cyclohexadiene-1,4-diol dehydrogenase n=1 Tax=Bosea thiooxidans TaxID=53254 RepID=A0A0Q3I5F1_9HYPH|nr:SDR family NAD(P)-dependent oxidoreductase [Bosea thiooxidans]KQK30144.1 2,5-dichloro-2,5-cyclohexadiene-1,4-diol dehydrogenase [Bosea thiooxidans]SKC11559.1 NAD(P)-dependent dehydrogenase, short-chain alcohol dehydrogenase family [Bosea thiooxidans]